MKIQRGDLFWCDFEPSFDHEQRKIRPCVVLQNNIGNLVSPMTIVAPITSKITEKEFPFHVILEKENSALKRKATILLNQIRAIDKKRLKKKIGSLNYFYVEKVEEALKFSLGLD